MIKNLFNRSRPGAGFQDGGQTTPKPRLVFAHYMVGLTDGQGQEQWQKDINDAKAAGIDGFALNVGPADSWTVAQLNLAYETAQDARFSLFVSFDMAVGTWTVDQVVALIKTFGASSAQHTVDGKPLVSTFEGAAWADNWPHVRRAIGGIHLVPNWTSLGPHGLRGKLAIIDGAFSWAAWPRAGENSLSMNEDLLYRNVLGSKTYMMGVSPYFYTSLPHWSKNWYFSSESLWFDRWQHAVHLLPDMIQIITWNDFGESSYICDTVQSQIVQGAGKYVDGFSHTGFRAVLPYFIAAYKAGSLRIEPPTGDRACAWYRTTPVSAGPDGGTIWGQTGQRSAAHGAHDVVSVIVVTGHEVSVKIAIGTNPAEVKLCRSPASFFQVPFRECTGPVTLEMNGRSAVGPAITRNCPSTGHVNFNAVTIHL